MKAKILLSCLVFSVAGCGARAPEVTVPSRPEDLSSVHFDNLRADERELLEEFVRANAGRIESGLAIHKAIYQQRKARGLRAAALAASAAALGR
jgi:hypothetical protein